VITIRRVSTDTDLHQQERELRQRVLLGPLGLTLADLLAAFPGVEERSEHFVAVLNHPSGPQVVACAVLLPPEVAAGGSDNGNPLLGKVMQVATDPQMQSQGIGRRLMVAIEARALGELGLAGLFCHARGPAIPFYERLGWSVVGEPFEEVGIEHKRMELRGEPAGWSGQDPEESL
jgi:GNAT superfamily N-acetyltransferase